MGDQELALDDDGHVGDMVDRCHEGNQRVKQALVEGGQGDRDNLESLGEGGHIREARTPEPRALHAPPLDVHKEGPHCGTLGAHRYEQAPHGEEVLEGGQWRRSKVELG